MIPNCHCKFCSKPIYRKNREEQYSSEKSCNECKGIAAVHYNPKPKDSSLRRGMDEVNAIKGLIAPKALLMQPWNSAK